MIDSWSLRITIPQLDALPPGKYQWMVRAGNTRELEVQQIRLHLPRSLSQGRIDIELRHLGDDNNGFELYNMLTSIAQHIVSRPRLFEQTPDGA
jgi:hypothetical protein